MQQLAKNAIEPRTGITFEERAPRNFFSHNKKQWEQIEKCGWHQQTAWSKTAALMISLGRKSNKMAISGKISNNSYDDKDPMTPLVPAYYYSLTFFFLVQIIRLQNLPKSIIDPGYFHNIL